MIDRCSASLTAGSNSSSNKQCAQEKRGQLLNFAYKAPADSPKTGATNNIGKYMRCYGNEPRIVAYLCGPQERIECITNDCYDNGQRKFFGHWGDTYVYANHIALHEKDGYKAEYHKT